jgi:hypothetical protein
MITSRLTTATADARRRQCDDAVRSDIPPEMIRQFEQRAGQRDLADIVVEELRKKEINGPIRLPKRDFFTRGQKLKVKDPGTFSPATIWNSPACRHVSVCA